MNMYRSVQCFSCCLLVLFSLGPIHAQTQSFGNAAAAEKYVLWAENAMEQGRWSEALIVLERGADYADVSSDISFLLAQARSHFKKPRGAIMEALGRALRANRWEKYNPEEALLLEAKNLIDLKLYQEALNVLALVEESIQSARLRLLALRFSSRVEEFCRYTAETMDRYPRQAAPVMIFLEYLRIENLEGRYPQERERAILDLILRRLSLLLEEDADLAWMAAPFIRDLEEAGRLVAAYRAVNKPVSSSIPIALNLGIIDERTALEELFSIQNRTIGLDLALLDEVWELLRNEDARELYRRNLLSYSGLIFRDTNYDGIPEEIAEYSNGMLRNYCYDGDQDGLFELILNFTAGEITSALIAAHSEAESRWPGFPAKEEDLDRIKVQWEHYPALLDAEFAGEKFTFRPLHLFYAPVQFREFPELSGSSGPARGILFPQRDPFSPALTRRNLTAYSLRIERPSAEFKGAVEVIELNQSIPVRAREYLDGRIISETDFLRGRPMSQRVDLDLDGRMETVRHFRRTFPPGEDVMELLDYIKDFDYAESDWDGDGIFETREYFENF